MGNQTTDIRLDELDRRILYTLMQDARNTTATSIADRLDVSGATVRNRIEKLETAGVVRGYPAQVDFERADGKLTNLYLCNVPVPEREALARKARAIPGVINVRSLMTGRENLHVLAVGDTTSELQRVSRALSQLGIEIEDEDLVEDEFFTPYTPFEPEKTRVSDSPSDLISLAGEANILEVTVQPGAPVAGHAVEDAVNQDILDDDTLVVGVKRDDVELTPHGDTVIRPDDVVTIVSRNPSPSRRLDPFQASAADQS